MKKFKKIFAALAASALVAAMSFTSMAASITINRGDTTVPGYESDTVEYTYYRVLKANIAGGNVSYYVDNSELADAIKNNTKLKALFDVREYVENGVTKWNVVPKDDYSVLDETKTKVAAEKIAAAFDEIKGKVPQDPKNPQTLEYFGTFSRADGTDNATATLPGDGYYLIVSSLGTKLAVKTAGNEDIVISEKNEYPTLTKTENKTTASYGEKITYTVTVSIPVTAAEKDIMVVDTMSNGLTPFDGDDKDDLLDVTAKVGETVLSGAEAVTVSNNGNAINITIPATAVDNYKGNEVTLTYQAVLNNNAQPTKAESNSAYLTYANYKSLISSVDVTTYGFELTKVDGAKKDSTDRFIPKAAGDAEFTLWDAKKEGNQIKVSLNSGNKYRVLTSGETETKIYAGGINHSATIEGLAAGKTYYLQEEKAPTGYNKLTERKAIKVVDGENAAAENKVEVENNAGIQLPSTGGMGTTVFAIVGLLVMAGAAVTLIVKKRA